MKQVIGALVTVCALAVPALAQAPLNLPDVTILRDAGSRIGVSVADADAGVVVNAVTSGSPAEKAGFRSGDTIVEFDGIAIKSARQFTRVVQETVPNKAVRAVVMRGDAKQTLMVTPEAGRAQAQSLPYYGSETMRDRLRNRGRLLDPPLAYSNPDEVRRRAGPQAAAPRRLGIEVTPLTDQLAKHFGVKAGVLVSAVEAESAAGKAGLVAGDVITSVNGRTVDAPVVLQDAVREAAAGAVLELRVTRDKRELTLKVTLTEAGVPRRV